MKRLIQGAIAVSAILMALVAVKGFWWLHQKGEETKVLRQVIERLSAQSRIAQVLVTESQADETTGSVRTTVKFLEFDADGKPLEPRYFTFEGNIIQFQALVIRFEDRLVQAGDQLRGKSAFVFLRAFALDDKNPTQVFTITAADQIPSGYKVPGLQSEFEENLWKEFWQYALQPGKRAQAGIKNAQIEAPGTMFVPGSIYTVHLEHAGGIRIDAEPLPEILKGEKVIA